MEWIDLKAENPKTADWYLCKLKDGTEVRVPFVKTFGGHLEWLLPDVSQIANWLKFPHQKNSQC